MHINGFFLMSIRYGCTFLLLLAIAGAVPAYAATQNSGTLELYGRDEAGGLPGKLICILDLVSATHDFVADPLCANDEMYTFKLINAPSATVISFYDTPDCNETTEQNFYIVLKTIKHPLTFEKQLDLRNVISTPVGSIVPGSGGVRMERKLQSGQINGKLSCVKIKRSEVPE